MWNQRRDNEKNKFLISYEMAAAMIPLLLCGTMIGVLLSKFLPPSVVTALLVMYLIYSTWKMFAKAVQTTKKENAERAIKKAVPMEDMPSTDNIPSTLENDSNLNLPQDGTNKNESGQLTLEIYSEHQEVSSTGILMKQQVCNLFLLLASYIMI